MNYVRELIYLLIRLQTEPHLVKQVLKFFFHIETKQIRLSPNEKNILGPLIYKSLDCISEWIMHSINDLSSNTLENYKVPRSGLEFLLEKYTQLSTGQNGYLLGGCFQDIKENLECWDEYFTIIMRPNMLKPNTLEKPEYIPDTHWWWLYKNRDK